MLMMSAPLSDAQRSALATATVEKRPALFTTFRGMIEQPGADPHAPTPLFTLAAATPEHHVPWPGSAESSSGLESPSPKSYPLTTFRSGWLRFTPVSMMAMITLATPNPLGPVQPASALESNPTVPTGTPVCVPEL